MQPITVQVRVAVACHSHAVIRVVVTEYAPKPALMRWAAIVAVDQILNGIIVSENAFKAAYSDAV